MDCEINYHYNKHNNRLHQADSNRFTALSENFDYFMIGIEFNKSPLSDEKKKKRLCTGKF